MPNRMQIMKFHALLAAFILPVACMFIITGSLYTWGIKGSYAKDSYNVQLDKPLQAEESELFALAEIEIAKLNISKPSGSAKLKTSGDHFALEWTGSKKNIIIEPTKNPLTAKLTVEHANWYRNFVQLHKAKGGSLFKIYAVIFAISILLLLISGFIMAWQTPKLKRLAATTGFLGIGSFIAMVVLS